jgi:hypothetical protein
MLGDYRYESGINEYISGYSEITGQSPGLCPTAVGKKVYFLSVGFFLQEAGLRFRQ